MSEQPIPGTHSPLYYFAKLSRARVSDEDFHKEILSGQIGNDPLAHLAQVAEQVYQVMRIIQAKNLQNNATNEQCDGICYCNHDVSLQPLMRSLERKQAWSDTISNEISENLITFIANSQVTLGHKQGVTYLPLPVYDSELDPDLDPRNVADQQEPDAEHSKQIHVCQSCFMVIKYMTGA